MTTFHKSVVEEEKPQASQRTSGAFDNLVTLVRWRKPILFFVLAATIVSVIVSFLLPKWYRSTSTLLPPKSQGLLGGIGGLSALIKEVAPGAAGKLGSQPNTYSYLAILQSRRAAETVIRKYNLMETYGITDNSMEDALKELKKNYDVEVTEEGAILVSLYDKDSVRAAEMTNYMVQLLNEISIELGTSEARSNREFLEKRVGETKAMLQAAEDTLKTFQEAHGTIFLPEDVKATASSLGLLYAQKVRAEVELAVLRKTIGLENPAYKQAELEKNELERKLSTFPQLGMESFRLYRDVVIQQKILELLVPLYEQARFEEQKDIPVTVVLDKAVPSEKKARPKRALIVVTSFLSSLILSVLFVLLIDRLRVFKEVQKDKYGKLLTALKQGNALGDHRG